jgi:competence protein ComEC
VPAALALTAGIVLDRHFPVSLPHSVAVTISLLVAWGAACLGPLRRCAVAFLWLAIASFGAAYHQWHRESLSANDIRFFATSEGRIARVRGVVHSEPIHAPGVADDPLRTVPSNPTTKMAIAVSQFEEPGGWRDVSGVVQATLAGKRGDLHVGDEVELVGKLALPESAANPGGFDYAALLRDQGIGATFLVKESPGAIDVMREGWPRSLFGWLAVLQVRGVRIIEDYLPEGQRGVAAALLLGEGSGMTNDDWDQYLRTGVIHVLAISGQHLVVLAGFLWLVCRMLYVRRRAGVLMIALLLLGYALLTGGRPPVMRSAWVVLAYTGGVFLRRPVLPANNFALAWLGVATFNPTDIFNTGCQLSFLAVAVLIWGAGRKEKAEVDPLQKLIDESRSPLTVGLLRWLRWIGEFYLVNALVWLAVTPLVAGRYHLFSPVALVIGPPVVLFSSLALLLGFGLLLTAPWCPPLALLFAWLTRGNLVACEALVNWSSRWPGAYFFVPDVPAWWLWGFHVGLLACLSVSWLRRWPRWCWLAGIGWAVLGCILVLWPPRPGEFRCTFLAVGHGGCTVLELPHGQVILYDAGAIGGPDVTRRHIAPFLWNRGYRRIDEIFISHGDLDHFNGLPALLERFSIGRVTLTPSYADRSTRGIAFTLRALAGYGLATRVLHAPARWETDGVEFEVLHPPAKGPEGNENSRSLVLAIRGKELTILLTGDLEGAGLERVLRLPSPRVDVLMAPHHGSRTANTKELAAWARPKLVVSCQGSPKSVPKEANPYEALGARWASTWSQGAVTIQCDGEVWIAEAWLTRNRWIIGH